MIDMLAKAGVLMMMLGATVFGVGVVMALASVVADIWSGWWH